MPTSAYWASITVEIAFSSNFATAAASRVWTDVSDYVEAQDVITINFGRNDERSQADANTLSLTLDNRDGRFTPGKTAGAYYPNVKLYRPIRVTATPPGGAASVRFVGYVLQWNVEWPEGTDAHAVCQVSASSRLQRLGLADQRRSIAEETVLLSTPRLFYALADASEATVAAESAGNGGQSLRQGGTGTAVVFGSATGPSGDGLTAATFAGGKYLTAPVSIPVAVTGAGEFWVECAFLTSSTDVGLVSLWDEGALSIPCELSVDSSGLVGFSFGGALNASPTAYNDGLTHTAFVHCTAASVKLYIDGALVATSAAPPTLTGTLTRVVAGALVNYDNPLTGVLGHVAVGTTPVTAATIAAHSAAILGTYGAESAIDRFARYAAWAGVPSAETSSSNLVKEVDAPATSGSSVVDLLRQLEDTEQGVLYDARDGTLTLLGATGRYTASLAFTLDMQAQRVGADYAPVYDPSSIVNDATVTQSGGEGASARVVDTTSRADYGVSSASGDVVSANDDEPLNLASWLVYRYKNPTTRVPSITVSVAEHVGATPSPDTLLAVNIGTLIRVSNRAGQDESTSADLFIEGYTETITPAAHTIAFNVSSATVDQSVLIVGDATRGVVGTNVVGY